jgi:hypothetical protein
VCTREREERERERERDINWTVAARVNGLCYMTLVENGRCPIEYKESIEINWN